MIQITRSQARMFRSVVRKAGIGKYDPTFEVSARDDGVRLRARSHSAAVELRVPGNNSEIEFLLPLEALGDCEGRTEDPVTFEMQDSGTVALRWTERQLPRIAEYPGCPSETGKEFPGRPENVVETDPTLWDALRSALACVATDRLRFAIDCLQLRGETSEVVATDGRQALIQGGYAFPWKDDVLIPASKVLGCTDLTSDLPMGVGRVDEWLAIVRGPWSIWLRIDVDGRFPEVESIVPMPKPETPRLELDPEDAEFLLAALPKASSRGGEPVPITVELNGKVSVRTKLGQHARATEIVLSRSKLVGEPIAVSTNLELIRRAIGLGFREFRLFGRESRVLCDDGRRKFVWALLDEASIVPANENALRIESPASPTNSNPNPSSSQRSISNMSEPTSKPTPASDACSPTAREGASPKERGTAMEQVVALRDTLKAAVHQANEVIRALKQQKREARIVQSTLDSLKQIQRIAS